MPPRVVQKMQPAVAQNDEDVGEAIEHLAAKLSDDHTCQLEDELPPDESKAIGSAKGANVQLVRCPAGIAFDVSGCRCYVRRVIDAVVSANPNPTEPLPYSRRSEGSLSSCS